MDSPSIDYTLITEHDDAPTCPFRSVTDINKLRQRVSTCDRQELFAFVTDMSHGCTACTPLQVPNDVVNLLYARLACHGPLSKLKMVVSCDPHVAQPATAKGQHLVQHDAMMMQRPPRHPHVRFDVETPPLVALLYMVRYAGAIKRAVLPFPGIPGDMAAFRSNKLFTVNLSSIQAKTVVSGTYSMRMTSADEGVLDMSSRDLQDFAALVNRKIKEYNASHGNHADLYIQCVDPFIDLLPKMVDATKKYYWILKEFEGQCCSFQVGVRVVKVRRPLTRLAYITNLRMVSPYNVDMDAMTEQRFARHTYALRDRTVGLAKSMHALYVPDIGGSM